MKQLSPIERDKARILKRARALINLKHAEARDDELNEVLPRLELEIDKAIQSGRSISKKQLEALIGGE